MTTNRRRLLLASLAAGLLAVGVGMAFGVHWRVFGVIRGEPTWRGMPASWYASYIRSHFDWSPTTGLVTRPQERPTEGLVERWARAKLPLPLPDMVWRRKDFWQRSGDEAMPVLVALLDEDDPRVAVKAMMELADDVSRDDIGYEVRLANVPPLVRTLDRPEPLVRWYALMSLRQVGQPLARPAVPKLLAILGDTAPGPRALTVGETAKAVLVGIDWDAWVAAGRP